MPAPRWGKQGKKYLYDLIKIKQDKSSKLSQSWKTKIDKSRSTYPAVDTILQVIDDVKFRGRKSKDDTIDADYLSAVERGDMETEAPVSKATKNRLSSLEASVEDSIPQPSEKSNTPGKKSKNDVIDADYLSAVERGDMETAQRMVDEGRFLYCYRPFFMLKYNKRRDAYGETIIGEKGKEG